MCVCACVCAHARALMGFIYCNFILQNDINVKYINIACVYKYASDLLVCITNRGRKMTFYFRFMVPCITYHY